MSPPSSSSSSGSDEDMETLRRARAMTGRNPCDVDESATESGGESSGDDDIDLLRRLQERFSLPSSKSWGIHSAPIVKPLSTRPPPGADEEDDFETLNAIRRRFAQYNCVAIKKKSENCSDEAGMAVANVTPTGEAPDVLSSYENCMTLSDESPDSGTTDLHQAQDETCSTSGKPFMYSHFPKSAQNFADALKKNRSCQKFIRRKLIEIQAKIEENKELRERVKCLMDFQVGCKKNVGRIFRQQKDPRIRLISAQKSSTAKTPKPSWRKVPALCFGPAENSHVSRYKLVMKRFPVSLHKQKWSNIEKENLAKGLKQQYQEIRIFESLNYESGCEGSIGSYSMPALSSSDLEVTPEKIRSFLHVVNWDRLASMYLASRSGAECESRWRNCEDPMINHDPWTISEEKKLLYIVQERGLYNWIDIAKMLGTHRTPFQCLVRYQRSLNPHILNKDWTEEEDAKLLAAVEKFGHNWQTVASNVEGRSGVQCSNRWRKSLHPDRRKVGRWSVDEDKRLKVAVILFGAKNWNKIAQFAPGRTQVQCRERWLNCLDPSLNLEPWTEEEDTKLLAAIADHGYSWSKVATYVPPRTDNQCRRRWKFLRPHEVPLLGAAKKMRRTVLISNFVDRENERPLIGLDDFTPLALPPVAEDGNRKRTRRNISRKPLATSRSSLEENATADGMVNSSSSIAPADLSLVPGVNSTTAENGSRKRAAKTRNNLPKKPRAKSGTYLQQNLIADGLVNSSSDIAPAALSIVPGVNITTTESGRVKRTKKKTSSDILPKKSRAKSGSSFEENLTADGMVNTSSDIVPAGLSLVPDVNPTTAGSGIVKRTKSKITRNNNPKKSRPKSRTYLEQNLTPDGVVNSSSDIAPASLSLVPGVNPTADESGSIKRTRKKASSDNLPKNSRAKPSSLEENLTADGIVNTYLDIVPAGLFLVPGVNSTTAGSGIMKTTRKKITSGRLEEKRVSCSGGPQPLHSNNSKGETGCLKEHTVADSVVNYQATGNASDNPIEAGLESPVENSRKRKRNKISRCRSNDSGSIGPNKPRAKRKTSPKQSLMADCITKDNHAISGEKRRSDRLITKRVISNQSSSGIKAAQLHLDRTLVNIICSDAHIPDGTSNTVAVSHSNTANGIDCVELSRSSGADKSLPDSKQECLDSEVLENNGILNKMRNLPELGSEIDENIQSNECRESMSENLDHSDSAAVDSEQNTESSSMRPALLKRAVSLVKLKQVLQQRLGIMSNSSETLQSQGTSQPGLKTSGNEPGPA